MADIFEFKLTKREKVRMWWIRHKDAVKWGLIALFVGYCWGGADSFLKHYKAVLANGDNVLRSKDGSPLYILSEDEYTMYEDLFQAYCHDMSYNEYMNMSGEDL
jgi:hypothetical protein